VFFVAILLAAVVVHASPLNDENADSEVVKEIEEKFEETVEDSASDSVVQEESLPSNEDNEVNVDSIPSEEEGTPYEEDEGKSLQIEDETREMTQDEMEKEFGIDIPMCSQYTNLRVPLHLR
jgi:hypothetical protein